MEIITEQGQYGFRALISAKGFSQWALTNCYYLSREEAEKEHIGYTVKWPVTIDIEGVVFIPNDIEIKKFYEN